MPKIGYNIKEHEETRRVGTNPTLRSVLGKKGEKIGKHRRKSRKSIKR